MSDRNMRNPRPDAGAAESRPDLMKDILPGGGSDDLDNLLASLADDVPDMPADFHAGWTAAVAEEAGIGAQSGASASPRAEEIRSMTKETENGMQSGAPAGSRVEGVQTIAKAAESGAPAGSQQRETQSAGKIRRLPAAWSRLIGVAAVMAFLVGGTLLTRDSFHAKMSQPVMASDAGGAVLQSAHVEESAANLTEADSDRAEFVTTDAEQPAMMLGAAPADEAAYDEAELDSALSGTATADDEAVSDEIAFEDTEEAAFSVSQADADAGAVPGTAGADAGVPAAGLMMSSLQASVPTAMPTALPEAASLPETTDIPVRTEGTVCPVREPYRGDSLSGTAEAVTEESFDAAMDQEQPAAASETGAYRGDSLSGTAEAVTEESFDAAMDQEQPAALSETARENEPEQIEPDRHPVLTFLRDMGFFIRWIAPWALVLAVGVFAGWLVGRRR